MSLGVKQLTKDPWGDDKLLKKYSIGTYIFFKLPCYMMISMTKSKINWIELN